MIERLLQRVASGDERAFEELYRLTAQKIWFYIYRLCGDREKTEDIMMETYLEIWRSAKNFEGRSRALVWMYSIARHLTFKTLRRERRHEEVEYEETAGDQNPVEESLERERFSLLARALKRLPLPHREVLDLVFFHGLRYEEVARILDIPVNTVKTRVFHAKKKLRKILEEMGVRREDVL